MRGHRNASKYRALVRRYHEFRAEDVVELCADHHEEIHELYAAAITDSPGYIYFCGWTRVEKLIARARELCDTWLKSETPGSATRIYTGSR